MAQAPTPAINVKHLSKRYPGAEGFALKNLSLQVMPGEVYGFLGPNGAGKSTTIRTLLNFIQPTSGTATIDGHDIVDQSVQIKRSIGYLAGDVALYPKMTGRQLLDYLTALQPALRPVYGRELINLFKIDLSQPIHDLSKGNRQKLGLIQAFAHEPAVLILDEPTSGLDPLMQELFFKLIDEAKERKAAIFVSSHNLAEVQKICDRVGFIREGKLVAEQTMVELNRAAAQIYDIVFAEAVPATALGQLAHTELTENGPRRATVHVHGSLTPLLQVLSQHKVVSLSRREGNLEDEFLHFYNEDDQS